MIKAAIPHIAILRCENSLFKIMRHSQIGCSLFPLAPNGSAHVTILKYPREDGLSQGFVIKAYRRQHQLDRAS